MARCKTGGESITQDEPHGPWRVDGWTDAAPHDVHEPRLTIVVEPAPERTYCAVCAWFSNYATLRVGEVDVCDDHVVSTIKVQHAMMAR